MEGHSNRRSGFLMLPGCATNIRISDFASSDSNDHTVLSSNTVCRVREVTAVQESSHLMAMNETNNDDHQISPSVSEYGRGARNFFTSGGPEENTHESTSESNDNAYCSDGPERDQVAEKEDDDIAKVQNSSARSKSSDVSEDASQPELMPTDLRQPYPSEGNKVGIKTQTYEEDDVFIPNKESKDSTSSSFFCSQLNEDSYKTLNLLTSQSQNSPVSQEVSEEIHNKLGDFLHKATNQGKLSHPYLAQCKLESVTALLDELKQYVHQCYLQKESLQELSPSLSSLLLALKSSDPQYSVDSRTSHSFSTLANFGMTTDLELKCTLDAQCYDSQCSELQCKKIQNCIMKLQNNAPDIIDLTEEEKNVLCHMYEHSYSCEHLHCPYYWCEMTATNWKKNLDDILAKMKQLVEHGYHGDFLQDVMSGTFLNFQVRFKYIPREGEDWCGLCRITDAKNTILALSDWEENDEYWIIKKSPMFDSESQMKLYENLRKTSHKGIASHLWAAFCQNAKCLAVCTKFEAFTLYDCLQHSPIKDAHSIIKMMLQLINTTHFLHNKGILYLNWSSKNVLCEPPELLKLTNFTCSSLKSRVSEDIGDIIHSLPRHLLAPEMFQGEADEYTDVWGLGCLLKEIFTGQPVWYEERHERDDVLCRKIKKEAPLRPHDCLDFYATLKACWEKERSLRPHLDELEQSLYAEYQHRSH